MRFLRLILLFGVAVAVVAVVRDYVTSRGQLAERAVAPPSKIPAHLDSTSSTWQYRQQSGANDEVLITAERFQQTANAQKLYLGGVTLRIEHAGGSTYDLITSPEAEFDPKTGNLYSPAEVEVTLGLRIDGADTGKKPTTVRAPGVTFDNNAATCWTDAPVRYEFAAGRGSSVGAFYDSGNGYFHMRNEAFLERHPTTPDGEATRVWADELVYLEDDQRIDLGGNVRLEQGDSSMRGDSAHVFLQDGAVSWIEAANATGRRQSPGRTVEFSADQLVTEYGAGQILERILAEGSARIESATQGGITSSAARQIVLLFTPNEDADDSHLRELQLHGDGSIRFDGQGKKAERRMLDAEHIALHFAGEDSVLDRIETHSRGRLTLAATAEPEAARTLDGDRITANYTAEGVLRYLRAAGKVRTANGGQQPPLSTESDDFEAEIDPETGETKFVHQWGSFRFVRGKEQGRAADARLTPSADKILLSGEARVEGPDGSLVAEQIELDQQSGGTQADGRVRTIFAGEQSAGSGEGVFRAGQAVYATADHMTRDGEGGPIVFRGDARLWQESNSVAGETITIRRAERVLEASGSVRTHLGGSDETTPMAVDSSQLRYFDAERRMEFEGSVNLRRGDLTIRANRLTSWLSESAEGSGSDLDRALARGEVVIARQDPESGERRGFGESAEYNPDEETVILTGDPAQAVRADGSVTQGARLAYDMGGDRLTVDAGAGKRVRSVRQPRRNP